MGYGVQIQASHMQGKHLIQYNPKETKLILDSKETELNLDSKIYSIK